MEKPIEMIVYIQQHIIPHTKKIEDAITTLDGQVADV
jgi:hypothetical protein